MKWIKPTIWSLVAHIWRSGLRLAETPRLRVALFLLLFNFPFGYLGVAVCTVIATMTGNSKWLIVGLAHYIISWLMLIAGTALAGSCAKAIRSVGRKGWMAWKRLRKMVCLAVLFSLFGCSLVKPPERPLAYMYPSLMPMSAISIYDGRAVTTQQVMKLLEQAGVSGFLNDWGFLQEDYSVLARGLRSRGYAEIDCRRCRKSPLKWVYIGFCGESSLVVMKASGHGGMVMPSGENVSVGREGELIVRLPLPGL